MQALHFGAGNIGKGLIGNLLNKTGYNVCFVDVNQEAVDYFNTNQQYHIELLDEQHTVETVAPVSALNSVTQKEKVIEAIVHADIITTSVGINNLAGIAPILSKGLLQRIKENKNAIDVIANENAINASTALKQEMEKHISDSEINDINTIAGFPNSAIDRLSLSETRNGGERTLAEPYYEWIINKSELINFKVPYIKDAVYVKDLQPYIERKLYIVNMGHAATAYIGFFSGNTTIQKTLENKDITNLISGAMNEASKYVEMKFGFKDEDLADFIEQTLKRFKNKNINDKVFRVGRNPIRKLSFDERLVKPARELFDLGYPVDHLTVAIAAGFLFYNSADDESVILQKFINEHGIDKAIDHYTKINNQELKNKITENYKLLMKGTVPFPIQKGR
ncbi:mannitol-1-phosphate 5-dehydrogenase [Virgibacillus sp. YIM 98842]|uniref:mannitol-1-phosphate 5-dehydrogenase n=1 Tax=Virgibacillus sp. YIM 98842 TaxID=2663533 RepID=UPI0013DC9EE1|nr:mannitol-1-phosphate 5-dehydrogenase [Virgibacillus sp. YIM 98842]